MTKYDIFTEVLNHSVTASYVIKADTMTLLHWEEQKYSKSVKTYFLDEHGTILEDVTY